MHGSTFGNLADIFLKGHKNIKVQIEVEQA